MKLFTPKEVVVSLEKKKEEDIAQIAYLKKTLTGLQGTINKENDAFRVRLEEQRKVYSVEKENLQKEIATLSATVAKLKEERKQQLIPVETLKAEASIMHSEAQQRLASTKEKEDETEKLLVILHEKMDDISDRESIIKEAEMTLEMKKSGIEAENEQVAESHKKLNAMILEFNSNVTAKTNELKAKEESLKQREKLMQVTQIENDKYFSEQSKILKDKREALDRLYKQINKK